MYVGSFQQPCNITLKSVGHAKLIHELKIKYFGATELDFFSPIGSKHEASSSIVSLLTLSTLLPACPTLRSPSLLLFQFVYFVYAQKRICEFRASRLELKQHH